LYNDRLKPPIATGGIFGFLDMGDLTLCDVEGTTIGDTPVDATIGVTGGVTDGSGRIADGTDRMQ
jgi:hypothetical protein